MKFFNTIYYLIALFLFTATTNAQEINLPTSIEDVKQVYHHNANNKNFFLLFENKKLQIVQTDDKLNFQKTIDVAIDLKNQAFNTVISNNDNLTSFWITTKEINAITTDLANGTSTTANPYPLKEKGELLIAAFTHKDLFYVLKVLRQSNILKLTTLDHRLNIKQENVYDFSEKKFVNVHKETVNLFEVLTKNDLISDPVPLTFIDINQPNNLVLTSAKNKYYLQNDKLYITLDGSKRTTDILVIDLNNKAKKHLTYLHDYDRTESVYYSSNSMLFDNKVIQFCGGSDFLNFVIRDESGNTLKHYKIKRNEESDFITGDVVALSDNVFSRDNLKEINKLNKVINKIGGGFYKGLTIYPSGDNYVVQFGEVDITTNNIGYYSYMFGASGALFHLIFAPNSNFIFNPYYNAKATIATTVLDKDLNPNQDIEIEEDKLAKLRKNSFIDFKNKMYKIRVNINNQDYYIKHELGSKTIDLMPY